MNFIPHPLPIHNTLLKGDFEVPSIVPFDINACELFIGLKEVQRGGTGMLFASVRQGFKSTFPEMPGPASRGPQSQPN